MELLDCNRLVDSGYKEEDLKDFELSAAKYRYCSTQRKFLNKRARHLKEACC